MVNNKDSYSTLAYGSCATTEMYSFTLLASSSFLSLDFTGTPRFLSQLINVAMFTLWS